MNGNNYIQSLCLDKLETPNYYYQKEGNIRYYVLDLKHTAPTFIKQAKEEGFEVYGSVGRRSTKKKWIAVCASGSNIPNVFWIKMSNGAIFLDYNNFDTHKEAVPVGEMEKVISCAHEFLDPSEGWTTGNNLISKKLSTFLEAQCEVSSLEKQHYSFLSSALRGGANHIMKLSQVITVETHIDYHQLYGYIMSSRSFPYGEPIIEDKFINSEFAIYAVGPGSMARLKPDGYPIIPIGRDEMGMAGADGEWFDVGEVIQFICNPDLRTMMNNYEFKDDEINIVSTMYYPNYFEGETYFKPLVEEIYSHRKEHKGQPEERFYKILNEILPGHFERRTYYGGFWKKNFEPNPASATTNYFNPKVGIFITAYARQMLDLLLHKFPHNKVIGYDTDCVFFNGTLSEIPYSVLEMFGPEPGQVHEDGYYYDVFHKASKSY